MPTWEFNGIELEPGTFIVPKLIDFAQLLLEVNQAKTLAHSHLSDDLAKFSDSLPPAVAEDLAAIIKKWASELIEVDKASTEVMKAILADLPVPAFNSAGLQ